MRNRSHTVDHNTTPSARVTRRANLTTNLPCFCRSRCLRPELLLLLQQLLPGLRSCRRLLLQRLLLLLHLLQSLCCCARLLLRLIDAALELYMSIIRGVEDVGVDARQHRRRVVGF